MNAPSGLERQFSSLMDGRIHLKNVNFMEHVNFLGGTLHSTLIQQSSSPPFSVPSCKLQISYPDDNAISMKL